MAAVFQGAVLGDVRSEVRRFVKALEGKGTLTYLAQAEMVIGGLFHFSRRPVLKRVKSELS